MIDYQTNVCPPGQDTSIRELLMRFAAGEPIQGKSVYYDGDEPVYDETLNPDFDLSDATRLQEEVKKALTSSKKEKSKTKVSEPEQVEPLSTKDQELK